MATAKQAVSKVFEGTALHHVSIFRKAIRQAKEENDRGWVLNAIKSLRTYLPLGSKEAKDLNDLIREAVDFGAANGYDWIAYIEEHWQGPRGEASMEIEPIIEAEPITQAAPVRRVAPQPASPQVMKQPKNKKAKRLNIEMAQRHLIAVKKWLAAGYLTEAQAEQLTRETVARVVGE